MKNHQLLLTVLLSGIFILTSFSSCRPDLRGSIRTTATLIYPGKVLTDSIVVLVSNVGTLPARGFHVDFVLSSDSFFPIKEAVGSYQFAEDILLVPGGRHTINTLDPGTSIDVSSSLGGMIPMNTPPGKYFLGAVFDPSKLVSESDERNNVALFPITVLDCATLPAICKPDLYGSVTLSKTDLMAGEAIAADVKIVAYNGGNARADIFWVDIVLSSDTVVPVQSATPSDVFKEDQLLMGGRERGLSISPLGSSQINISPGARITIPKQIAPGNYYLAVVFDSDTDVSERNEANNVALIPIRIVEK